MKTRIMLFLTVLILVAVIPAQINAQEAETEAVKTLIETSYIHGAFNELNATAMRDGFHQDFAIFSAKGEEIGKYPIDAWAKHVENKKKDTAFDPDDNIWKHKFAMVDVTGGSAMAKVLLFHKDVHVYTDYLSLLKFDSGWKIVAKVYHKHPVAK